MSPLAEGRGLKRAYDPPAAKRPGSPLAEGRGLKQSFGLIQAGLDAVAPRRGAWIETPFLHSGHTAGSSPLAEGRGLKPSCHHACSFGAWSPLAEGRGLKLLLLLLLRDGKRVAPRRGAWIETRRRWPCFATSARRPSQRGVD